MIADSTADTACFWEVLFTRRNVLVALILFLVIAVLCLLAPLIAPADPFKMAERARLAEPGALYWLGADAFSRDMTSRLLYAGQASRTIGLGGGHHFQRDRHCHRPCRRVFPAAGCTDVTPD
jgi:peptide/nickel transport system permease protein